MPEALALVKRDLGPDAFILGTRCDVGLLGRTVEIHAAPPRPVHATPGSAPPSVAAALHEIPTPAEPSPSVAAAPPAPRDASRRSPAARRLHDAMVAAAVDPSVADALLKRARETVEAARADSAAALRAAVADSLGALIPGSGACERYPQRGRRVALVGVPGSGKTVTAAKLAAQLTGQGVETTLVTLDTERPGSTALLMAHASVIGVSAHEAASPEAYRTVMRQLRDDDCAIIDTPGVGLRDAGRFARLSRKLRAACPVYIYLVVPASVNADVQSRTKAYFAPLGIAGVVVSHVDEAAGLGAIVNVACRLELPVLYTSDGQNVPFDLKRACGRRIAEVMFRTVS